MKKFLILFLFFSLFFLVGCTLNPNKNLVSGTCCFQSDDLYSCEKDSKPVQGTTDLFALNNCGEYKSMPCAYFNSTSGEILDPSKQVIRDDYDTPIKPNSCSKNCNFDKANCTNQDNKNICYSLTNTKITYPICVNDSFINCIQNNCKLWMCGEKKPMVVREYSFSESEQETFKENYKSKDDSKTTIFYTPIGLVGKTCEFRFMNASSFRLLKEQNWIGNSIRLGFLGSFSDYEVGKYYFPPSDAFCSAVFNKDAVVDSFIRYLKYDSSSGTFRKSTVDSFCYENQGNYTCKANPTITFPTSFSLSKTICDSFCSKLFDCPLSDLNFLTTNVSPPNHKTIEHYLLNISSYYLNLVKLYSSPSDFNFYRKEGEQGIGPEGAKAFECIKDSDCLSNLCKKDIYFRGRCFNQDGSPVDCNCTLINYCEDFFKCDKFPKDSIDEAQCEAGKFLCKQNSLDREPVVICKYSPTTYPLYAYKDLGKKNLHLLNSKEQSFSVIGEDSWGSNWGVYDFSEFNKYKREENGAKQQLEFANIVTKSIIYGCLDEQKKEIVLPSCPSNYKFVETEKTCIDTNNSNNKINPFCANNTLGPQDWMVWKDADSLWFKIGGSISKRYDGIRWQWGYAFFIVPTNFVVSSTLQNDNKPIFFITSRNVSFTDLKRKLPFIETCELSHSNNIDTFEQADIIEISIKDIPLQKHKDIEKYIAPFNSHPYLLAGGNKLEISDQEKKAKYLFDKTWVIKSFGKCQKEQNILKTKSFGLCDSCGTFITFAYQPINKTKTSYCPDDCGKSGTRCDCRSPLYSFLNQQKDVSEYLFENVEDGYVLTIPEFSYLIYKIHTYLENNVIPILDLKDYAKEGIGIGKKEISFDSSQQSTYGPYCSPPNSYYCTCDQYSAEDNSCIKSTCKCTISGIPDPLFLFLNKDHKATISILDYLTPSALAKIKQVRLICKECPIALEFENTLNINSSTNITELYNTSNLNSSISNFFGVNLQAEENLGYPPNNIDLEKIENTNVDILVLNINFNEKSKNKENYKKAVENAANISRYILHHVGKPTIWKLRFSEEFKDSLYSDPVFLDTLFSYQNNLTLSGVIGILLPSLLEKNENVLKDLTVSSNQPFCSLVNGSLSFLQLSFNQPVNKLQAKDKECTSNCVKCPSLLADDPEACNQKCLDGSTCPTGYSCPKNCISTNYCQKNKCEDNFASKKIVCYFMPSYSKYFNSLNKLEIINLDEFYNHKDMPEIVAALNEKCCFNMTTEKSESFYTYVSNIEIDYTSSTASYPFFGSTDTNCGQFETLEEQDPIACSPTDLPNYVYSKKLYYCFWKNKI